MAFSKQTGCTLGPQVRILLTDMAFTVMPRRMCDGLEYVSSEFRILIIDDQAAILQALEAVLSSAGYRNLKCLDDSRYVIPAFFQFQPDLIVLDLHMPHVDGLAVIDQLAGVIRADDFLPILVLTGDPTSRAKEKCAFKWRSRLPA
jgi:PleD family two-component response regulator